MKSNHKGKRVFGVILLILSILTLPISVFLLLLCYFPNIIEKPMHQFFANLASAGFDVTALENTIANTPQLTGVIIIAINLLVLLFAIALLCMASLGSIAKMHDVYGLQVEGKYFYTLRKLFLFLGIAGLIVTVAIYWFNKDNPILIYVAIGSGIALVLGILLLFPVPLNIAVKRRYHGNKYIVTITRNVFISGFNPTQILNELQAADDIEDLRGGGFSGRIRITFSSDMPLDELKENRKYFHKEAKDALKTKDYLENEYEYEIEDQEGHTYESSRDLHSKQTSTTTTYYTDGSKETRSSTKDVVTGKEITTKKSSYQKYYFYRYDKEDEKKYYVYDENDNILCIYANWKSKVTGVRRVGTGD